MEDNVAEEDKKDCRRRRSKHFICWRFQEDSIWWKFKQLFVPFFKRKMLHFINNSPAQPVRIDGKRHFVNLF